MLTVLINIKNSKIMYMIRNCKIYQKLSRKLKIKNLLLQLIIFFIQYTNNKTKINKTEKQIFLFNMFLLSKLHKDKKILYNVRND